MVDSHTGGEPTRVVVAGGPELGRGAMAARLAALRRDYDWLRRTVVNEPRGSDVLVGALLCEPADPDNVAGVLFFNNVGYLAMCGHGSIGLAVTLAHLGRLAVGSHRLETPPGAVTVTLHDRHRVSVGNVESYRHRRDVTVEVPGLGKVTGDIAWGGNWFFLIADHGQDLCLENAEALTSYCSAVQRALQAAGIRGADGGVIDHVELFGPPADASAADSRNFVLCPGRAYDRSPCGTGTSAKLACLIADGVIEPGQPWRQQGITGSVFEAVGQPGERGVLPVITGSAYVTGESTLLVDADDPFRYGIRA